MREAFSSEHSVTHHKCDEKGVPRRSLRHDKCLCCSSGAHDHTSALHNQSGSPIHQHTAFCSTFCMIVTRTLSCSWNPVRSTRVWPASKDPQARNFGLHECIQRCVAVRHIGQLASQRVVGRAIATHAGLLLSVKPTARSFWLVVAGKWTSLSM